MSSERNPDPGVGAVRHDDFATATPDPIERFHRWYSEAQPGGGRRGLSQRLAYVIYAVLRRAVPLVFQSANLFRPDVATLATVGPGNRPSARSVLFQGVVDGGFSFYTDYQSDKGRELDANPSAVMLFYWSLPPRQVRIDGHVVELSRERAAAYWATRTRANQAASASVTQSSVVSGRHELLERKRQIEEAYRDAPIPCPNAWGGYALVPDRIEFWEGSRDWVHHRERFTLRDGRWERAVVAP